MPVCRECHIEKPINSFYLRTDSNTYRTNCIVCYQIKNSKNQKARKSQKQKYDAERYAENAEKVKSRTRLKRQLDGDQVRKMERAYYRNNPGPYKANAARRKAALLKRTPNWAKLEAIKEFYSNCPEGFHVDHVIPLQGKDISGLHILSNLQYLPAEDNLKKGNRL